MLANAYQVPQRMPLARYFSLVGGILLVLPFYFGCISSETADYAQGRHGFVHHPYSFRSEMAGAHCLRYEPPDNHSRADRERGGRRQRLGNDRRRLSQSEGA